MKILVVIPVFNEEQRLTRCLPKLHGFLSGQSRFEYEIVIANNASTDRTQTVAEQLCREFGNVRLVWLPQKGRGGALKTVWLASSADILTYMDVDLSTDLAAFPALVDAIASHGFDLAIGSRLLPASRIERNWKRELISRSYVTLIHALCPTRLSDAQCGFKAVARPAALRLLPLVEDREWFFDTELLLLAEKLGYRICELPVRWVEDPNSRVRIFSTALADVKGLIRLRRKLACGMCRQEKHVEERCIASAAGPQPKEMKAAPRSHSLDG
ncbi:MAG: glycosyltransferase family 2 protein [Chloroflexi bacterium]|nr:glycosyltransferase family 2 protein [Chloroflexota bacterium]